MIDHSIDGRGVALIVWNSPDGPVNIKNAASMAAFVTAADRAIADPAVKAVVIGSAKRDFLAGGDLVALYRANSPEAAAANVAEIGACFRRMERSGKPFVAALNGSALGGGLELALACHHRVAADDPALRLGCPEVTLGLIPGAGGTQRLPRLVGIEAGARMLLEGRQIDVAEALQIGLVGEIVPAERLLEAASAWALAHPGARQPWDEAGFRYPGVDPTSAEGRRILAEAAETVGRKTAAGDVAPAAQVDVLRRGLAVEIDAALAIEAQQFGAVAASPSAKNRIRAQFIAVSAARKGKKRPQALPIFRPKRVGVVGAGRMGGGIALVCAMAGLHTILLDTDAEVVAAGIRRIDTQLAGRVARGGMEEAERRAILGRLEPGADYAALDGCEAVIEAVVEAPGVKAEVFRRIAEVVGDETLIASNTSTLSISELAAGVARPQRFIGLHFFAPVDRMKLVEVIRGRDTSDETLARAGDLLKLLRKTTIVVNDGPGFFTSRVVAAYTREALSMLSEGVAPDLIDRAALGAGLPIGPIAMADLTSYDLLGDIITSLAAEARGTAIQSDDALDVARTLVRAGRPGGQGAGGVYDYVDRRRTVWPGIGGVFSPLGEQPPEADIVRRLLHIQSLETVHAMDEGIAADPLEIDLASVLGWSYPTFRGGVLAHIDDTGLSGFVGECDELADRHGERFRPPTSLRRRAETGEFFHPR